jgi:hypothetical protein
MRAPLRAALVGLALLGTGCVLFVPKETLYLKSKQDRATQAEVRQRLGEPREIEHSAAGESQWRYEIYDVEGGSQQSWAAAGSWCDRYVLSFDAQGVLRRWTHTSYLHGGENMPARCDDGVEKLAL